MSDPAPLVRILCGVQSQEPPAAALAIRARTPALTEADVNHAKWRDRSVVLTWCMRGTLHLVAAEDLGWLLPLLAPATIAGNRRRYAELGLDEETTSAALRAIRDILAKHGPATRSELAHALAARRLPAEGQAVPHLLGRAALEGILCFGPVREGEATYVLLGDWVTVDRPALDGAAASEELARRYLEGYAPARPDDFAAWSGLRLTQARAAFRALSPQLVEVDLSGSPAWLLKSQAAGIEDGTPAGATVRLLPGYDPYLLGYRSRDLMLRPEHAKRVHPGGGVLHPVLLVDGRAAGTWRTRRDGRGLTLVVEGFTDLGDAVVAGITEEVKNIGAFLNTAVRWRMGDGIRE